MPRMTLTLVVDYKLNGESLFDIAALTKQAFKNAISDGALTGDSPAEVELWRMTTDLDD